MLYQICFFSKIHPAENGSTRAIPENLLFFLDVTSNLFQHISGFSDIKYQMTWCIEHEKYPNCVRLCTVFLGSQNLEAKIRPNQCIYIFPCTQCVCTYNYQSLCHDISLLQLLKNMKTFDFSENWLSNSINPNLAPTVRLQGK